MPHTPIDRVIIGQVLEQPVVLRVRTTAGRENHTATELADEIGRVGIVGLDPSFRITFFNRFQAFLFADSGGSQWSYDAIGVPLPQRYRVLDERQWDDLLGSLGSRTGPAGPVRTIHRGAAGVRHLLVEVVPVQDAAGALQGAICVTDDVTRQAGLEEEVLRRERLSAVVDVALALHEQVTGPLGTLVEETRALCEASCDVSGARAHCDAIQDAVGRIVRAAGPLATLAPAPRTGGDDRHSPGAEPGSRAS